MRRAASNKHLTPFDLLDILAAVFGMKLALNGKDEPKDSLPDPQSFSEPAVHDWYRTVWGYSDQLVRFLLNRYSLDPEDGKTVIDPFCGTGTTLVECKKAGLKSFGIDANPACVFATKVKTNWGVNPAEIRTLSKRLVDRLRISRDDDREISRDLSYQYLLSAGMIKRGWIDPDVAKDSIRLKMAIRRLLCDAPSKELLQLAMLSQIVNGSSNVRFGPELYCGARRSGVDLYSGFAQRCERMASALETCSDRRKIESQVVLADAREVKDALASRPDRHFDAVICSPPYPAEHDYTRNQRLELVFLEAVTDLPSLRKIKQRMIRSNTKGIYKSDNDSQLVDSFRQIRRIVKKIDGRVSEKTHGFAKLYSRVVSEYFGGMARHFSSIRGVLKPGAQCAYVLGDQSSFAGVHISTAAIVGSIAETCGFRVTDIITWRGRRVSGTTRELSENILLMENRARE